MTGRSRQDTACWRYLDERPWFLANHRRRSACGGSRPRPLRPGGAAAGPERPATALRLDVDEIVWLGWDPERLAAAFDFAGALSTDALAIVTDGRIVAARGDLAIRHDAHSARKAFLGALTPLQLEATVEHLLKSMSGINHPAAAEQGMLADKNRRLGDRENRPGTIWAYNNWDYNALTVAEAFKAAFAEPLGMQGFSTDDVRYIAEPELSRHRAAMFRMSARDLLRFGELYLDKGVHDGRRLLPEGWVDRIATVFAVTGRGGLMAGHGDLWWIPDPETGLPAGSFWAMGIGSQALFVVPVWRTVIVHQSDTTEFWRRLRRAVRKEGLPIDAALERLLLSCLDPAAKSTEYCRQDRFILRREFSRLVSLIAAARR